jgi:hypothetical protein
VFSVGGKKFYWPIRGKRLMAVRHPNIVEKLVKMPLAVYAKLAMNMGSSYRKEFCGCMRQGNTSHSV